MLGFLAGFGAQAGFHLIYLPGDRPGWGRPFFQHRLAYRLENDRGETVSSFTCHDGLNGWIVSPLLPGCGSHFVVLKIA